MPEILLYEPITKEKILSNNVRREQAAESSAAAERAGPASSIEFLILIFNGKKIGNYLSLCCDS